MSAEAATRRGLAARVVALAGVTVALALALGSAGCAVVPQNRRKYLADPLMRFQADALEAHAHAKLYSSREAAAGGDGEPAGGGCACQ